LCGRGEPPSPTHTLWPLCVYHKPLFCQYSSDFLMEEWTKPITISYNHTYCAAGCGTLKVFLLKELHFSNVDPGNGGGGDVICEVNDIYRSWIPRKHQRNDKSYNGGTECTSQVHGIYNNASHIGSSF